MIRHSRPRSFVTLGVWLVLAAGHAPVARAQDAPAASPAASPAQAGAYDVSVRLLGKPDAKGGQLEVIATGPADQALVVAEPEADGLTFTPTGAPKRERVAESVVITTRYRFTGAKGSYQVGPVSVRPSAGEPAAASSPLWIDLGVEPPERPDLADIDDPSPVWRVPWPLLGGAAALGSFVLLGVWYAFRAPAKPVVAPPPPPADLAALQRWERVRADGALTDEQKATELSAIFRWYTEQVLQVPAQASTTSELLDKLAGMSHLAQGNVPRAKRLLRATDLVKFAEVRPGQDFFVDLDADLRAFVDSTKPRRWEGA